MIRILLLLLLSPATYAQVLKNPDEAFTLAQTSGKEVLLIFSGSDWCIPCIQFNKTILADSSFQHFAQDKLVLLEADFPQRKKIPAPLRSQYESLAAEFNPNGAFPQIVLLTAAKKLLAQLPFNRQTPADFITTVRQQLPK
ncbi:thioredoxin family protein [Chitinophaga agrisoli]|nr:thioredoxin family protein [Chitinophaga agrisoli]